MPIEQAMVARARPHMLAAKARLVMQKEMVKGCLLNLCPEPVALEPHYWPLSQLQDLLADDEQSSVIKEPPFAPEDVVRLRLWIGEDQELEWTRPELFLKQLQALGHRALFEIIGNDKGITASFLCHKDDEPVVQAAFLGEFFHCDLSLQLDHPFDRFAAHTWRDMIFRDYYPPPPYSHLLTRPNELRMSPFAPLMNTLARIPAPALGVYQVVFQPVALDHDWHRNVQILMDLEYAAKLFNNPHFQQRYAQQAPSGDLRNMAMDVETKSHNDKPFFAAAVHVGVIGNENGTGLAMLRALSTFMHLFQHGGRPLEYLNGQDYRCSLPSRHLCDMFRLGTTYRSGFLVNSAELAGLVHIPPVFELRDHDLPVDTTDGPPPSPNVLSVGTLVGTATYLGRQYAVRIPPAIRMCQTHVIGEPGVGKSCVLEHMGLEEIGQGHGVAILDPHGDLAERILCRLPEHCAKRVIYFEPGNPEWIPLWNPLKLGSGQDASRTADEIVAAIKSISDGWGDRLGTLLHQGIRGFLHVKGATLFDVAMALKVKPRKGKELRNRILGSTESQLVYEFWRHDIDNYGKVDFGPVQHKLNKLMSSDTVELMLSQPDNRINFRTIMDEGMVFIANLSRIGPGSRDVLGEFILSFLHLAALSRSAVPPELRKPFHTYVDEAHRFVGSTVEDLIAETRKYRVSLTLAHQYLRQFTRETIDALGVVGSTIMFGLQQADAERMAKTMGDRIQAQGLTSLGVGEAVARIGTEVVRITTPPPSDKFDESIRDKVVQMSRERYCRRACEVREVIRRRCNRRATPRVVPSTQAERGECEELRYAEL